MKALGLTRADFAGSAYKVFPDCWKSVRVMKAIHRQWRVGPGGPYGLDYNVLSELWLRCRIEEKDRDQIFEDLQVMEDAALELIQARIKRSG